MKRRTNNSRVKELRKKNHQSQQMLADSLGTSQQTISRIESNIYSTPIDLLMRLSTHFNVTVDYLLELTDISVTINNCDIINERFKKYYEFILEYDGLSEDNRMVVRKLTRNLLKSDSKR